jgi:hypothetical protein
VLSSVIGILSSVCVSAQVLVSTTASYLFAFQDGSMSFSASFDPDDPTLIDRYPNYTSETDPGERPPTPTQQRGKNSMRKASNKKKIMSAIP